MFLVAALAAANPLSRIRQPAQNFKLNGHSALQNPPNIGTAVALSIPARR
jgi:hypothetical protein